MLRNMVRHNTEFQYTGGRGLLDARLLDEQNNKRLNMWESTHRQTQFNCANPKKLLHGPHKNFSASVGSLVSESPSASLADVS